MTTYELYINDILCDLSSDEVITLLYQSPIFSSLDSIQSNRSYNIALPPTPTNMRAIGQAARPDVDADAPYVRLPAALYQDGVPLFTQGFAVVTDIADTINVTLTWGNADNFQPLFDANLRDLGPQLEEAGAAHIDWNENTAILEGSATGEYPGVAFWGVNFGMGLSNPKYLHPSVQVSSVLSAIEKHNGITIDGKERLAYSKNLGPIIPLVARNGDEASNEAEATTVRPWTIGPIQFVGGGAYDTKLHDPRNIVRDQKNGSFIIVNSLDKIRLSITNIEESKNVFTVYDGQSRLDDMPDYIILAAYDGFNRDNVLFQKESQTRSYRSYNFDLINTVINTSEVPNVGFELRNPDGSVYGDIRFTAQPDWLFKITAPWSDVVFPSVFPIAANLPDISQGDFILAMMSMNGLFAYADKNSPNTIKLISIDDIIANVQNNDIIDWSDRVILNDIHRVDMPDASAFTIDDLAQSNILDYDNDDDVKTDTRGTITIRNENIEKEAELVELPFSASENATTDGVNCAVVPIYEDDGKGGANYSECSPRILSVRGAFMSGVARCIGVFDPWMKFGGEEGIVNTRYSSYQKVVDRLRIITIRAKLTALDLHNLDYSKPVYIAQFGHIFAIYSVETGEDGICDCQLLKLKIDGVVPTHYYLRLNGQNADQSETDITSAGTTIRYIVQSNGTPYVVSKDSRLTADIVYVPGGILVLSIEVPNNASEEGVGYNPVIVGVRENDAVRRRVSISQKGQEYYLMINGHSSDFSIDATADGEVIELTCATYGTPRIQTFEGDAIDSVDIQGDIISIATNLNPSAVSREAIVVVELEEDPAISITVTVKQAAAVIPSIAFNPRIPWSSSDQTVTILNDGNVPLSIVSVPSFISNDGLPISLAPGGQTTRRISANDTGVQRLGNISMEYSDALGQIKTYNVSVRQKA